MKNVFFPFLKWNVVSAVCVCVCPCDREDPTLSKRAQRCRKVLEKELAKPTRPDFAI